MGQVPQRKRSIAADLALTPNHLQDLVAAFLHLFWRRGLEIEPEERLGVPGADVKLSSTALLIAYTRCSCSVRER